MKGCSMQTVYTYTYLERCTLVGKRTVKKRIYERHYAIGNVGFERTVRVGTRHQVGAARNMIHVNQKAFLEQTPHVIRSVDFLHFHFGIDVTVIQKTNVCFFHLLNILQNIDYHNVLHHPKSSLLFVFIGIIGLPPQ